ncbi:MAG: VOC family protein [Acidimicrobiia bacterium]
MGTRVWAPGTPSWVQVTVRDVDKAQAFYTALFGWEFADQFDDGGSRVYSLAQRDGQDIAGMGWLSDEMAAGGMPCLWGTFVTVENVDKTAARVAELGGTVMLPPMDVMDAGRMVLFMDPTGAALACWEPRAHNGADLVNEPGTFCWSELQTRDTKAAESFYTQLFGWTAKTSDAGGMAYTEFALDGRTLAGMMAMPPMVPAAVPPAWLVYFAVDDCDAAIAKVGELGGSVVMPPMDIPVGRFALVHDDQGAMFYVMRMNEMPAE